MKKVNRKINKKNSGKNVQKPRLLPVLLAAGFITIIFLIFSFKKNSAVRLYFKPEKINLRQEGEVKVMVDVGNRRLAFARIRFIFDPEKIMLASGMETNRHLSTVIAKTDTDTANNSGDVLLVIAASPEDVPPTGKIELASFEIKKTAHGKNGETYLDFVPADLQLVDKEVNELRINSTETLIELKPRN